MYFIPDRKLFGPPPDFDPSLSSKVTILSVRDLGPRRAAPPDPDTRYTRVPGLDRVGPVGVILGVLNVPYSPS